MIETEPPISSEQSRLNEIKETSIEEPSYNDLKIVAKMSPVKKSSEWDMYKHK